MDTEGEVTTTKDAECAKGDSDPNSRFIRE